MGRNPIRQRPTAPVRMLSLRWHYPNQVTRVEGGTLLSACHTSSPTIYLYTPILYTHCLTNTSLAGGNFGGRWSLLGPPQGGPCGVVSRPVPGGGSRLSLEKARTQRVAGGGPPPPLGLGPARCHSLVLALGATLSRSIGYYEPHVRTLIWRLSFAKMLSSIFSLENASQIGFRIPEVTAPRTYQRQRS